MKKVILLLLSPLCSCFLLAQINTDRVSAIGRNALYFEDYVLAIQYFNQVIKAKPWLAEPYFYRAVAKINLDDYKGAEEDCSLCLERNPFLVQAYFARGIARQSLENFDAAIADYDKGLEFKAEDRQMLINKAVACIQKKDYGEAEKVFEELVVNHSRYAMTYMMRGAMYFETGDTLGALDNYNRSVELDPYYPPAYGNRAIVYYRMNRLREALADLNEAIRLNTRESGYYINRGLVRYQMNDLRGAMADYDQVIGTDSRNLIARFNRGLLRAQVGDRNRAIEDFDVVIAEEPDNHMAYYNRAILRGETGDYAGAVSDFSVVLDRYPDFLPGYYSRAEARRKMRDHAGADKDEWMAFRLEEEQRKARAAGKAPATDRAAEDDKDSEEDNTREQSDRNMNKFNRLVVYDREEERKSKYQSDVRGRVQDRNVKVDLEPQFVLTYYEKPDAVKKSVYYDKVLEEYNERRLLSRQLRLTNEEAALTESQVAVHFGSIDAYSARVETHPGDAHAYFARGIDYMLVQDFAEAIRDYTLATEKDPDFALAYFNRAVVRYKQLEYDLSRQQTSGEPLEVRALSLNLPTQGANLPATAQPVPRDAERMYAYELIQRDYDRVIQLNPGFLFAYFNRGNLFCAQRDFRTAILDYNEAILRDPDFAEAYFNRGLARLSLGDANRGIADLSKAGELGIVNAYGIIKRMTGN
ncbi:MAG: tetratricopeptide repeat protein [Tannerellaceae bacterium]|jgi:tetratricopeptide (TPR) repeat protein|nr:tetratricopeptide repeat protein [Tannerellaceae bacterium]